MQSCACAGVLGVSLGGFVWEFSFFLCFQLGALRGSPGLCGLRAIIPSFGNNVPSLISVTCTMSIGCILAASEACLVRRETSLATEGRVTERLAGKPPSDRPHSFENNGPSLLPVTCSMLIGCILAVVEAWLVRRASSVAAEDRLTK